MTRAELGGRLLSQVSRSFYLSIRLLPPPLREPIGLAYLLARASDTIADSGTAPVDLRLRHLHDFGVRVATADSSDLASGLKAEILPTSEGESALIANLGDILLWLQALDEPARVEIQRVLATIIRGQVLDLEKFALPASSNNVAPLALKTAAELEEYTYLVAGCVGEFWTRLSLQRLGSAYSTHPPDDLSHLGVQLGQALQLVNILRDLPADLRQGRCYLPADELAATSTSPEELLTRPTAARPVFKHWLDRTSTLLEGGRAYISAVRLRRARAACFLPWYLAEKTVALLRQSPPLETPARVKVPRRTVYAGLWKAFTSTPPSRSVL